VHSHSDGVMHWHPTASGKATGTNAKLGVYLDNYGIELTDTKLALPPEQSSNPEGDVFEEGKTVCKIDGVEKDASLKLWVWDSYTDLSPGAATTITTDMRNARLLNDGMVFMIAFVPDDVDPIAPDWASELLSLGAADGSGNPNATSTTVAGEPSGTADTVATSDTTAPTTPSTSG